MELQALKNRLLGMGALVEERVHTAMQALMERRIELAEATIAGDVEVNDMQIEIDDRCLKLLALQNPMASDLRLITAAMKINADLERIGDQAVNIAENAVKVAAAPPLRSAGRSANLSWKAPWPGPPKRSLTGNISASTPTAGQLFWLLSTRRRDP